MYDNPIFYCIGVSTNENAIQAANELDIGIFILHPDADTVGLFSLSLQREPSQRKVSDDIGPTPSPIAKTFEGYISYAHPETVLLLHTSGTSGNKKCVPFSLDNILVGVGAIVSSWNLQPSGIFDCLSNVL